MSQHRYLFNRWGAYLGYVDHVGQFFDKSGAFQGSVSDTGTFQDEHGALCGRIDAQGQYWDARGNYSGYFLSAVSTAFPPSTEKVRHSPLRKHRPIDGPSAHTPSRRSSGSRHT